MTFSILNLLLEIPFKKKREKELIFSTQCFHFMLTNFLKDKADIESFQQTHLFK
jgi:hypothetical protein